MSVRPLDVGVSGGAFRRQLIGLAGVVERNTYLIKRYAWWELAFFIWTVANTLTIMFIAKGVKATGGHLDVQRVTTSLLIGAVIWSYLGIIFEILTETVAWERWEGTIEYTFMAPLSRAVHLGGMGLFAVLYGVLRTALLFAVVALFFGVHLHSADFVAALVLLAVASLSFVALGGHMAAARARRGRDPARAGRVQGRRALRQAPRQAEALRLDGGGGGSSVAWGRTRGRAPARRYAMVEAARGAAALSPGALLRTGFRRVQKGALCPPKWTRVWVGLDFCTTG